MSRLEYSRGVFCLISLRVGCVHFRDKQSLAPLAVACVILVVEWAQVWSPLIKWPEMLVWFAAAIWTNVR